MAQKALNHQMNRIVRVNRAKLIDTLTENRTKHVKEFNEAMAGYKGLAMNEIEKAFGNLGDRLHKRRKELEEDIAKFSPATAGEYSDYLTILQAVTVNLKVPQSYADAYDAAIDMAKFDTRDELELSGAEFQCFCRDVWDWSSEFTATTSFYNDKR
jgi:uncharacterized protein YfbU (UPF0304 family)